MPKTKPHSRARVTVQAAFDGPGGNKRVTGLIRRALGQAGPIHLAVAYVTRNLEEILPVPRARLREVTLICDPWSGACNPEVLERLYKSKAKVFARERLHAKVYVGPGGAVVGSANASKDALIKGTEEAAVLLSGPTAGKEAATWVEALAAVSTPLGDLMADPEAWGAIHAAWSLRQRRKSGVRLPRPSLLEALEDPFNNTFAKVRIDLIDKDAGGIRGVKSQAGRKKIALPDGWDYTYMDGPPSRYTMKRYAAACEAEMLDCTIFSLQVKVDKRAGEVLRFTSLEDDTGTLLGTVLSEERVIWYFGPASLNIDLTRDRRELLKRLNASLKRGGKKLRQHLWQRSWWSLKPKELADLLTPARKP